MVGRPSGKLLERIIEEPEGKATGSVIWLHGLGATGYDFAPMLPLLPLKRLGVRVVLPHAPELPVTINGGMVMPAWYDILELSLDRRLDESGVRESASRIEELIAAEKEKGIPAERICLTGFSQGGAMALHTGLRHGQRLAGIAAMSCYLLLEDRLGAEAAPSGRGLPIFLAHGSLDPLVPYALGVKAREKLSSRGHPVDWHEYPMEHQVCDEEIRDLGAWFESVFS